MNKKLVTFFSLIAVSVLPMVVFAQQAITDPGQPGQTGTINPLIILGKVLDFLWPLFIGASLIIFVYAGLMFVIARGDPSKISSAKSAVVWAVVGIVVAILGFGAVATIKSILPTA